MRNGLDGTRPAQPAGRVPDSRPEPAQARAHRLCLARLDGAPRTRAELAATLTKAGIEDATAATVLDRLTEVGLIDDAALAQRWVVARQQDKGLAAGALAQELRRRGVAEATLRAAVDELAPGLQEQTARELVERRLGAGRMLSPTTRMRRLTAVLARRGYPDDLAYRVVREALAADGVEFTLDTDGLSAPLE